MSQPDGSHAGSSPRGSASVGEAPPDRPQEIASDSSSGSGPSAPAGGDTARAGEQTPAGEQARTPGQSRPPRPAATVTVTSPSSSSAGAAAARRGNPRQARLELTRVDPWSVLKLSLVLSLALFVVGLVAVMVLYFVLEGMGVPDALNEMVADVTADPEAGAATTEVLSLGRVFALSLVVGAVNVVLMTALATLGAFLYNLCADVVGGVDVTLSERE